MRQRYLRLHKRLLLQRLTPELSRPAAAKLGLAEAAKRVRLEGIVRRNMPGQAGNCNCGLCRTEVRRPEAHSGLLRAQSLRAAPLMTLKKCREELRGQPQPA
jgi:hypothetical protein